MRKQGFAKVLLAGCALLMALPECVLADPPPWAPAHGWRRKQADRYVGYTGSTWDRDYGILGGRCDRRAIGAAAGAVVGGVIGSQVGGDHKTAATVVGAVIGSIIGTRIAAEVDAGDRACIGQSLELANRNAPIFWVNPATRISYALTPLGGYKQDGRVCREFMLRATAGSNRGDGRGFACQTRDGTWQIAQKEGKNEARRDRDEDNERDHERGGKGKGKRG